jgi:hypothetical protein
MFTFSVDSLITGWTVNLICAVLLGVAGVALLLYAVLTKDKTLAALGQLGSNQGTEEHALETSKDTKKGILKHDQFSFVVGVVNVFLTGYVLGLAPTNFYLWHTPKAILLVGDRWWTFYKGGKHFLLADFCYWANLLCLCYCWIYPHNTTLFQIIFLTANGPVAWSVLAFGQSLIFHSRPHMTSVFIHVSPMLLSHGLRFFQTDAFTVCEDFPKCDVGSTTLLYTALAYFYLPWIMLYYVLIFLVLGKHIKVHGLQTLYDRVTTKGPIAPLLRSIKARRLVKKAVYMGIHLAFGIFTMTIATAFWHFYLLHVAFITVICTASVWNASNFYFTVFTAKYLQQLEEQAREKGGNVDDEEGGEAAAPSTDAKAGAASVKS